jgi:protein gp37
MGNTSIEWTQKTWNPTRGCDKVSPGCKHCYAETFAERFRGVPGHPYERGFDPRLAPDKLAEPLKWKKPARIFVNSMSDLFHESFSNEYIAAVFGVMAACPQHTFQVLTKRAGRLPKWFEWAARDRGGVAPDTWVQQCAFSMVDGFPLHPVKGTFKSYNWPLPNVWLGVSVENQQYADERIPHLLRAPAAVRFLSVEPQLGSVDLTRLHDDELGARWNALEMGIHWVIVGGESGHGARPFEVEWARSIVRQCAAADVPVFVKQFGAAPVGLVRVNDNFSTTALLKLKSKKGGDIDEWPPDLRVREFPKMAEVGT